jgi:hypothetical protein
MAANFHAVWGLIVPASIILGLGAAPLWSAKCTYLTRTAVWYAKLTDATEDDVINKFFGFFFMVFQTSELINNKDINIAALLFPLMNSAYNYIYIKGNCSLRGHFLCSCECP